jgi:hypothetical protein
MLVPVHESPSGSGWARAQQPRKTIRYSKYVLMNHQYVHGCTLQNHEKFSTKYHIRVKKYILPVVHTWGKKYVPGPGTVTVTVTVTDCQWFMSVTVYIGIIP